VVSKCSSTYYRKLLCTDFKTTWTLHGRGRRNLKIFMLPTLIITLIIYCITIVWLIYGFTKVNSFDFSLAPINKFTIVVPFRNAQITYPTFRQFFLSWITQMICLKLFWLMMNLRKYSVLSRRSIQCSNYKNNRVSNSKDATMTAMQFVKAIGSSPLMLIVVPENWLLTLTITSRITKSAWLQER
jgi:hypothetical protein